MYLPATSWTRNLNPRVLSYTAPYDVASAVYQALEPGRHRRKRRRGGCRRRSRGGGGERGGRPRRGALRGGRRA